MWMSMVVTFVMWVSSIMRMAMIIFTMAVTMWLIPAMRMPMSRSTVLEDEYADQID